jgi:hypothetical protein
VRSGDGFRVCPPPYRGIRRLALARFLLLS